MVDVSITVGPAEEREVGHGESSLTDIIRSRLYTSSPNLIAGSPEPVTSPPDVLIG